MVNIMLDKILEWLGFIWVRNRDSRGRYVPDKKNTKFRNEAWTLKRK
jgi:hypothetical protein